MTAAPARHERKRKKDKQMEDIVIIGSGNVAESIAVALGEAGHTPLQVFARNKAEGSKLAAKCGCQFTNDPAAVKPAELYIIAVSDKAIPSVSAMINFGDSIVAHTSGCTPVDDLAPAIKNKAVLYPLQSFTKGRRVDFSTVPVMVEGTTAKALEVVTEAAKLLSDNVMEISSEQRAMIHVAAVFASNFTNHMYVVGELLAKDAGMDFSILKPLIQETTEKAMAAASPITTQTGPAVRNDFQTKSRHCDMLAEKPDLKNIYINLSNNIWATSKKTSQK